MYEPPRHKVFLSYHNADQRWKDQFVRLFGGDFIDKSVEDGDIDDEKLSVETIRQKIRDEFIRDATVTVVLIGPCTWQRKYVDWEIGSSLRDTELNPRCGVVGILLPNHPDANKRRYYLRRVPPRLADNLRGNASYAKIYEWTYSSLAIRKWVDEAFSRRNRVLPDNRRRQFKNNRSGSCFAGWRN